MMKKVGVIKKEHITSRGHWDIPQLKQDNIDPFWLMQALGNHPIKSDIGKVIYYVDGGHYQVENDEQKQKREELHIMTTGKVEKKKEGIAPKDFEFHKFYVTRNFDIRHDAIWMKTHSETKEFIIVNINPNVFGSYGNLVSPVTNNEFLANASFKEVEVTNIDLKEV